MIRWWIGLWDRRELADSLALVRALIGTLVFVDLLQVVRFDLVTALYAPHDGGGLGNAVERAAVPWLYTLLPATASTAQLAFWAAVVAAAAVALGVATRLSALVLLLLLAQLALIVPAADRGIDMLIRNTLMVLVFSSAGAAWSVDARLRSGRWAGHRRPVPSWPRYLLVIQLVLVYSMAGVQKVATSWLPTDWSALWIAMHDPHFGRFDAAWSWSPAVYQLSRAGTAVTWTWEWAAPLVLLAFWFRDTADRPGRLRAACNRWQLLYWYAGLGALFHVGTHLVLRLGIFPFAVLSLYPALVHPDAWGRLVQRIRSWHPSEP